MEAVLQLMGGEPPALPSNSREKGPRVGGKDLAPLLLPLRRSSWHACDGARKGTVRLEGALADVLLRIDLDSKPVATVVPCGRKPDVA